MLEQVAELFVRLAQLANFSGATPANGSGIDGVWTTTVPAQNQDLDLQIGLNCDTETAHTVSDAREVTANLRPTINACREATA